MAVMHDEKNANTRQQRGVTLFQWLSFACLPWLCLGVDSFFFSPLMSAAPAAIWLLALFAPSALVASHWAVGASSVRALSQGLFRAGAVSVSAALAGWFYFGGYAEAAAFLLLAIGGACILGLLAHRHAKWSRSNTRPTGGSAPWRATFAAGAALITAAATVEVADRAYFSHRLRQLGSGDAGRVDEGARGLAFYPLRQTLREDDGCWAVYRRSTDSTVDAAAMHQALVRRYGVAEPRVSAAAARLFGPDADASCSAVLWRGVH